MFNGMRLHAAIGMIFTLCLVSACQSDDGGGNAFADEDSIMRFVPADTPYLIATGEQLPDDMLDELEPKIDEMLQAYQVFVREAVRAAMAKNDADMSPEEMQKFQAVIDELTTLLSLDGLRNAGFERGSRMAFFGHGLLPVFRVEVSDEQLFDDALTRIEVAADTQMDVGEIDNTPYRYVGDEDGRLIIATVDGNAVFTFLPGKFEDAELRQLLGLSLPSNSIAETTRLTDIAETYGYTDHYIGLIDVTRIASTFANSPSGLDASLLNAMEYDSSAISDVCRKEVMDVAGIAPRMVFGYEAVGLDAMSGSFVVELREDIASGLTTVAALVPGLGTDPGGLISMGVSFNVQAVIDFYEARLNAMEADPYECEWFMATQAGVAAGRAALNQPMPPFVHAFRGFNAVIDNVEGMDLATDTPPESVDGSLLVAIEDAQTMLAMGAMFSPELATLNLQPDGKPVMLDVPALKEFAESAYAAMLDDAIAISVGDNAESRVTSVLNAASTEPPPVMSMTMDAGKYYELIAAGMMMEPDVEVGEDGEVSVQPMTLEAREAMRDAMLTFADMYDRMAVDIRFTQNGMEIDSRVTLAR